MSIQPRKRIEPKPAIGSVASLAAEILNTPFHSKDETAVFSEFLLVSPDVLGNLLRLQAGVQINLCELSKSEAKKAPVHFISKLSNCVDSYILAHQNMINLIERDPPQKKGGHNQTDVQDEKNILKQFQHVKELVDQLSERLVGKSRAQG